LILEAYGSLASHQKAANDAVSADDFHARLASIGNAYRDWAVTFPQRYLLIFGTPIPGYIAPLEIIAPVAASSLSALISVVESYQVAGRFKITDVDTQTIAVLIWTRVHGLVSVDISNNLPPMSPAGNQLFQIEFKLIVDQFFMN